MPLGRFLTHRVSIVRSSVPDPDDLDSYGQPVIADALLAGDVPAAITPKSAQEKAASHQAGAAISTHLVWLKPRDVATADHVLHVAADCPVAVFDLPDGRYELLSVPLGAGTGHHLECEARLVRSVGTAIALSGS